MKLNASQLQTLFLDALNTFNEKLDSEITPENTVIVCCTYADCPSAYEKLCSEYFPKSLDEPYKEPGYFDEIAAMAFVGETHNGILIRTDTPLCKEELWFVFLHELAHIFCTRNEIAGGHFFDKYCMGSGVEDSMMNAGYAIWREAVADIMADSIRSDYALFSLDTISAAVRELYETLSISNPVSKKQMALIAAHVMCAREVSGTEDWTEAQRAIKKKLGISDEVFLGILEHIFNNLHESPFWAITPEFIMDLGSMYLMLLSLKQIGDRLGK